MECLSTKNKMEPLPDVVENFENNDRSANVGAFLPGIIASLMPFLVGQAEKLFGPKDGQKKHEWVMGFGKTVISGLDKVLPGWVKPEESLIEALIDVGIETALNALGI